MITEPNMLSDVKAMLDAYGDELTRAGQVELALRLKGLEIFDLTGAGVALSTLQGMPEVGGVADCVRRHLIGLLRSLFQTPARAA
jgi:hypothetical protein